MATPEFVLRLRSMIGTYPLPLVGTTGIVRDGAGRLLLGRRADVGEWALPSGIVEPGEEPAVGCRREVLEETGVLVRIDALAAVSTTELVVYANGDQTIYLDLTFLASPLRGTAHAADEENTEVRWFAPEELPPLRASSTARLRRAAEYEASGRTWFAAPPA